MLLEPKKTLAQLKQELIDKIDAEAAAIRRRHITLADGMELIYAKNQEEAKAYVAVYVDEETAPEPDNFPCLLAISTAFGLTLYQAAQVVLYNAQDWMNLHIRIEIRRLPAKEMVMAATSSGAAVAAADIDWESIYE